MKHFLLLCSTAVLWLSGCKKEPADPLRSLPEATQTGANTMGCLVDGQAFTPNTDSFLGKAISVRRYSNGVVEFLFSQDNDKLNRTIIFYIRNLRQPGVYPLDQAARPSFPRITPSYGNYITSSSGKLDREYLTGPAATGQLTVTRLDSVAQIVSGTFDFTAQETNSSALVHIMKGRFDVQYKQ